ncbi:IS110 family transposase [Labrys sp. (in: a-proteobacteria)]|uniref:IS110 family transposase n=1 Tax=Labrys sp. (in: a-proteobacteria) TaxID=1917972 RepID=UPI0039E675F2
MRYFAGIDIAKELHWICVVDENALVLIDRALPNTQEAVDTLCSDLRGLKGELVVGLDVMGSVASFLEAALVAAGFHLVHVPGIAVNRARVSFAGGETKSDPRDARVIAEQTRIRRDLRTVAFDDETTIAIRVLIGRRRDLTQDQTKRISRLRRLVGAVHPGLEKSLDFRSWGALHLLSRFVTPSEIRRAGVDGLMAHIQQRPKLRRNLVEIALKAATAQHTFVPGETAMADMARELASEAIAVKLRLARLDQQLEERLTVHPDAALIRSLPGMGAILTAEFIAAAGNIVRFKSADAMAAAAGLAPVLRQSGKSRTWRRTFGGDKDLKRVFFQGAFCACTTGDPISRAFYQRKRREGKHHTQAIIALARRRVNVLWTMLKTRTGFDPKRAVAA